MIHVVDYYPAYSVVVQAYAVCIRVTPECRWMESEMIRDGQGRADKADEAYHDICSQSIQSHQSHCICLHMFFTLGMKNDNKLLYVWPLARVVPNELMYSMKCLFYRHTYVNV